MDEVGTTEKNSDEKSHLYRHFSCLIIKYSKINLPQETCVSKSVERSKNMQIIVASQLFARD